MKDIRLGLRIYTKLKKNVSFDYNKFKGTY